MKALLTTAAIAMLIASSGLAQQQQGQFNRGVQRGGSKGGGPGTPGSNGLAAAGLTVGQQLPDITVHDAAGQPFRMADLKGKYSVIVFGCLT